MVYVDYNLEGMMRENFRVYHTKRKPVPQRSCPEDMKRCPVCGQPYCKLYSVPGTQKNQNKEALKTCMTCKERLK